VAEGYGYRRKQVTALKQRSRKEPTAQAESTILSSTEGRNAG
jgi:hypothetical protein